MSLSFCDGPANAYLQNKRGANKMKKPAIPTEHQEQCALIKWSLLACAEFPVLRLLHSSGNGARVSIGMACKLKASGMKSGVPDLLLPVPCKGKHGLFIELKRRQGGQVSPEQVAWLADLLKQGYEARVCRGWEAARAAILEYLEC